MSSRKLDEVAADIDDATVVVEELQDEPGRSTTEKLDELQKTLEDASDTIESMGDKGKEDRGK